MATRTLWATLDEFLVHKSTGHSMGQKKWKNNTWALRNYVDGSISVRLHGTDVVRAEPNGDITLRTGGYHTVTTKARINEFLDLAGTGWKVFQKNHEWFISHYAGGGKWDVTEPFHEGMTLYALTESPAITKEADPLLEALLAEEEAIEAAQAKKLAEKTALNKLINEFPAWADAMNETVLPCCHHFNTAHNNINGSCGVGDCSCPTVKDVKKCQHCKQVIYPDNYTDTWVDYSGGDACGDDYVHAPMP